MKRTVCLLIFLLLSAPVLAADNSAVVMNTKTYIYHSPPANGQNAVPKTV